MGMIPEPEGVDFVVESGVDDPRLDEATSEWFAARRREPGRDALRARAEAILKGLGIRPRDYGMEDAQDLLDHWRRCVEDLTGDSIDGDRGVEASTGQEPSSEART